ncbi:hypothetical protein GCM10010198_41330 [Nocardia seriolae]|nr:hypothetical protein NSERKGN1266_63540 [Nocardia seriolae]BEK93774.1 hypothetical protein NSER024013_16800 [Nocardia seriolae]GEM27693.1 hypothetical protein NS2_59320 [Nocardia seriolae NBRC 15557]
MRTIATLTMFWSSAARKTPSSRPDRMVMIWRCESVLSIRTGAATFVWVELLVMFGALVGFRLSVRAVLLEKTSP